MALGMGRQNQPELVEVTFGAEKKDLTTDLPLIDVFPCRVSHNLSTFNLPTALKFPLLVCLYAESCVVASHIQRIGCQHEKITLHGGQSRSWSAEQGQK